MLTKETLEAINADLRRDRQNIGATDLYLEDVEPDEEKPVKVQKQHVDANEELEDVDINDLAHMKVQNKMVNEFAFCGLFFGLDVNYGFAMYRRPLFYLTSFFLIFALSDIAYTAYDKFVNGSRLEFLEPLGFFGTTITLSVKWLVTIKAMNNITCLVVYTPRSIIRINKTGVTADIIHTNLKNTSHLIDIFTRGVGILSCFYLIIPLKYFLIDNEFMPILPLYVPFCDTTTLKGYLWASGAHVVITGYSGIATVMAGSGILIAICNYGVLVDLVEHDIKTLDYMWKHPKETTLAYRHAFLNNICNKLQDMRNYVKLIKATYELNLFVYFFMAYSGQVFCIFAITQNNWLPGYTTAGVIFIEMAFYCIVGTKLNTMDEKLTAVIYNQCDWYNFDLKSKKTFLMLLHASQMPNDLQLGPIGTLNMDTGVRIVKSIYTYYTILTEAL